MNKIILKKITITMTSIYLEDFPQRSKCPRLGTSEASEHLQYLQEVRPGGKKLENWMSLKEILGQEALPVSPFDSQLPPSTTSSQPCGS